MSDNKQDRLKLDKNVVVNNPEAEKLSDEMLEGVAGGIAPVNSYKDMKAKNLNNLT